MATLSELLAQKTQPEMLQNLLTYLNSRGYPLTDFYSGSVQRTILEAEAQGMSDLTLYSVLMAESGYIETATEEWLSLLAYSQYSILRKSATATVGTIRVFCDAGYGPINVDAGAMIFSTPDGKSFFNTAAFTVPDDNHVDIEIKAVETGSSYNVASNAINIVSTPILGITCGNVDGWITSAGVDVESDAALRTRAKLRWAELGYGATADAYKFWALSASSQVTKVRVLDNLPRGQGTVDVIIYGDGALGSGVVDDVNDYIQLRKPITADVDVYSATQHNETISATIYYKPGTLSLVQAAVTAQLNALQAEVPIGGTLYKSRVIEALFILPYVTNVVLVEPTVDAVLTTEQAIHLVLHLTYTQAS